MKTVGGLALAVLILLVMVTVHEFGHYLAGKILKFQINEFAVGFGPALFKKRSKKTGELFALRLIPLGGYCAFEGEEDWGEEEQDQSKENQEESVSLLENSEETEEFFENDGGRVALNEQQALKTSEKEQTEEEEYPKPTGAKFTDQAPWKRIIVLVAGATMNYLLALTVLLIMFFSYGCIHSYVAFVGEGEKPVAQENAVSVGDIVLSVNGHDIYLATDYADALSGKKQGEEIVVEVLRKNQEGVWEEKTLRVISAVDCDFKSMTQTGLACEALGLNAQEVALASVTVKEGFFQTIGASFTYSFKIGGTVLRSLGELITGRLGLDAMGGPVTTISVTAQAASQGLLSFLNIAAFIGVNLAVFNLLPIPALDGCKVIFCIIEWIRKKPVNRTVETWVHLIGIIALFGFAILVDVLQLFV